MLITSICSLQKMWEVPLFLFSPDFMEVELGCSLSQLRKQPKFWGQIPLTTANETPGFPWFWRKLRALSAFSFFPLECKLPSAGPATSRGILSPSGSQWKVLKVPGLVQPIPRMGIPTSLGNSSDGGAEAEPGEGTQRAPKIHPSGCEQIPRTALEGNAHFSILMG